MILNSFSFQYHGNARAVFGACLHAEYMNCPEGPIDSIFLAVLINIKTILIYLLALLYHPRKIVFLIYISAKENEGIV